MTETSGNLDLTDRISPERSDNVQHAHRVALVNLGLPHKHGRQLSAGVSSFINLQDLAEMTPKEETEANSLLDPDYKDVKVGFEELCPVCGDKVSGYHYGLLTCESCKGFFKRTVQNKKVYSCVDNRNCQIDKSQRKRCPYCRFQKCLGVGMKLEAVRSDRMRGGRNKFGPMYKRDRALKMQAAKQAHLMHISCSDPQHTGGLMEMGAPGSPEDVKPDLFQLQVSLNFYSGGLSNQTLTNCVPASVATTSSVSHAARSSPPPVHPLQPHMNQHSSQHILMPVSPPSPDFTQGFGSTRPQPHSPKTYIQQHNRHHTSQQHLQQHQNVTAIMECADSTAPARRNQNASCNGQVLDFQTTNGQICIHNPQQSSDCTNNGGRLETYVRENDSSYQNTTEAVRIVHRSMPSDQGEPCLLSSVITDIKSSMVDESEVKHKMLTFMQNELSMTDISSSPEQFLPVLCRMVDQLLFLMVEWARNSVFFKEIKVEDQMKLLHNSWSEILILDFIYRQIHNIWGKEMVTPGGELIGYEILDTLGLGDIKSRVLELVKKGRELKFDFCEYMCLKFLILLNPDVSGLENRSYVEQSQEKVNAALFEYCMRTYPCLGDKFSQLLIRLPEIRVISIRMEDFLYFKHLSNEVPDQTLLTEMLHAKRRG